MQFWSNNVNLSVVASFRYCQYQIAATELCVLIQGDTKNGNV